ncbi:SDR family NAD(P)-dependent oxidoreductase [Halopiger goleimassiliensis]|uniref:SDR family NAD(P)-dependent oxidoreductase n=1 Tax=Halopiger goleimassiliensis TaxID=1293048 RepID=UPI000677A2F4|nr:SDR family NAD(P)-dependent oxidoreductase [Halopiger goleimassiliensis]
MTCTAVIAGVGPGLGESLARTFVDEGCQIGLFARSEDYLEELADALGSDAVAAPTDITDPNTAEYLDPDAIADSYWYLVTQDRSSWTLELDLRPHVEEF